MKIQKTIEILQDEVDQRSNKMPPYVLDALTLSIKVLSLIKLIHEETGMSFGAILPGETPPSANHLSNKEVKRLQESPLGREPSQAPQPGEIK